MIAKPAAIEFTEPCAIYSAKRGTWLTKKIQCVLLPCDCLVIQTYCTVSGFCIKFTGVHKDYINDDKKILLTSIQNRNTEILDCGIINFCSEVSQTN